MLRNVGAWRMTMLAVVAAAVLSSIGAVSAQTDADFARAARDIRRLPPSAIPDLPQPVLRTLQARGCTIPQSIPYSDDVHNAARGHFTTAARLQWAILCSQDRQSSILIVDAESGAVAARVAERSDGDFLQTERGKVLGFSGNIEVVSPDGLQAFRSHPHGDQLPPTIDHDGIDDQFVEKYSRVWYWTGADWVFVAGSD